MPESTMVIREVKTMPKSWRSYARDYLRAGAYAVVLEDGHTLQPIGDRFAYRMLGAFERECEDRGAKLLRVQFA